MEWKLIEKELPPKRDEYYIFGGFDYDGNFGFDRFHFSNDGRINGWIVKSLIWRGYHYWAEVKPPRRRDG